MATRMGFEGMLVSIRGLKRQSVTSELSQSNRVPRGFEFGGVEDPVRVFGFFGEPGFGGDRVVEIAFEIQGSSGLQFGSSFRRPGGIHDGVHIHVTGKMGKKVGAFAGQEIDDAGGEIAGGQNFRKRCTW